MRQPRSRRLPVISRPPVVTPPVETAEACGKSPPPVRSGGIFLSIMPLRCGGCGPDVASRHGIYRRSRRRASFPIIPLSRLNAQRKTYQLENGWTVDVPGRRTEPRTNTANGTRERRLEVRDFVSHHADRRNRPEPAGENRIGDFERSHGYFNVSSTAARTAQPLAGTAPPIFPGPERSSEIWPAWRSPPLVSPIRRSRQNRKTTLLRPRSRPRSRLFPRLKLKSSLLSRWSKPYSKIPAVPEPVLIETAVRETAVRETAVIETAVPETAVPEATEETAPESVAGGRARD